MSLGLDVVLILRQLVIRPASVNPPIGFPGSSVPKDERLSIQEMVLIFSWTTYIEERSGNSPLGNFEMFLKDVK